MSSFGSAEKNKIWLIPPVKAEPARWSPLLGRPLSEEIVTHPPFGRKRYPAHLFLGRAEQDMLCNKISLRMSCGVGFVKKSI